MIYRDKNYFILNTTVLQDKSLSLDAKGLHCYLMTLPDDWKIYLEEIQQHSLDQESSILSAMNELEESGYVKKVPEKRGWTYDVFETK